ncbi:hypothetical protein BVTX09c1_124 [Bovine papular stomatitis virus]|uniref:Uncharacterized protein n=1 Tax=Bovine papular stomatitis virus TaxID=129727 RepID=A0A0E3XAI5_9POXV|nr:hypothetical protein BVTX09c1_124 [Bovine papular stomatitis virus]
MERFGAVEPARLRNPGPWRVSPPMASALEGAMLNPVVAHGTDLCANARVETRNMGVGEGRHIPADVEGLRTEVHLRYGMSRVHRTMYFAQFWHGEHVVRRPSRCVFTVWVCLYGEVRVYAESCQAGQGFVLCRQLPAGHMFITEPSDMVTVSVPHALRGSRRPVWLVGVFATRHYEDLPPPLYPVPAHVVLARSAGELCNVSPSAPQRQHGIFFMRLSGTVVRLTMAGAELEVECVSGHRPDHLAVDDECRCCELRPHVPRSRVLTLVELCSGATVVLAPPLPRGGVGLVAEIRLDSGHHVCVRVLRCATGSVAAFPSVVWTGVFSAAHVFLGGSVPVFAACMDGGRGAYGLVFIPEGEERMSDGVTAFPTPREPVALHIDANGAEARAMLNAPASGAPAAAGAAAAPADQDVDGAPDQRDAGDAEEDDMDAQDGESDAESEYSYATTSSEEDSDSDDSWGDESSSDSGIEHDDGGAGQVIEEELAEEAAVLNAVAEMLD